VALSQQSQPQAVGNEPHPLITGPGLEQFGRGLRPSEGILCAYLLLTVVLLPFFHTGVAHWMPLFFSNLALAAGLYSLRWAPAYLASRPLALTRRILPLLFIPLLYTEARQLNDMFFASRYFDTEILILERALFHGQVLPLVLHQRFPYLWLSEYLHFAYLSYYLIIPTPLVAFAARGRWADVEEYLTALVLIFVACQLVFVGFPVAGPFHHFPEPDPHLMGPFFPPLVHSILHSGSSVGTAFPSSHCAVAAICWIVVLKARSKKASWFLAALVPALTVGTVYGGFHYGVDALAGWILTLALAPLAFSLHARWQERRGWRH
jgi:membrane-associated phospholipid phosphatase